MFLHRFLPCVTAGHGNVALQFRCAMFMANCHDVAHNFLDDVISELPMDVIADDVITNIGAQDS